MRSAAREAFRRNLARTLSAVALALLVLTAAPPPPHAAAATPAPSEPAAGDTRSSGEGAGLVGQPLVAVGLVLTVGIAAAGITLAYVRLTGSRRD
jgi:hypothetical protein